MTKAEKIADEIVSKYAAAISIGHGKSTGSLEWLIEAITIALQREIDAHPPQFFSHILKKWSK